MNIVRLKYISLLNNNFCFYRLFSYGNKLLTNQNDSDDVKPVIPDAIATAKNVPAYDLPLGVTKLQAKMANKSKVTQSAKLLLSLCRHIKKKIHLIDVTELASKLGVKFNTSQMMN